MAMAPDAGRTAPAAARLLGLRLDSGWQVIERIERTADDSGGNFSCQYVVERNGHRAFLKALDYSRALSHAQKIGQDFPTVLQSLVAAYNFERNLLRQCASRHMDRVVLAIEDGSVYVEGELYPVNFLIFERADGDVRKHFAISDAVSCAWKLRCLHHIATGLWQLHSINAAHQDLKPSNVLVFDGKTAKVADLGCASVRGVPGPRDERDAAGDPAYAPPDLLYGYRDPEWGRRRQSCDLYHLGSMCVFMFCGLGMTAMTLAHVYPEHRPRVWGGDYSSILPEIRNAFGVALAEFASAVEGAELRQELSAVVGQLCDPEPGLRGHPSTRLSASNNPFSLERYLSVFDRLASVAERQVRRST